MILGVIPARGGSKGVINKNIRILLGKPLVAWTIEAARKSKLLNECVVSTESDKIGDVVRAYGGKVLKRPDHLAKDEATTLSTLQHSLEEFDADVVVVLQPTSPIRDDDLIDRCITYFQEQKLDCMATGFESKAKEYGTHDNMRRQDTEGVFVDDGNVYVIKADLIRKGQWTGGKMGRFELEGDQCYQVDTELEMFVLEALLERRLKNTIRGPGKNLRLLALDVDGVLTDSGMVYSENGDELKRFNTKDGMGIELLRNAGFKIAFITKENTRMVQNRAQKLKVDYVHQGVGNKLKILNEIAADMGIGLDQIAYIGDDINDTEILEKVGFAATPRDGIARNKQIAHYVCSKGGGEGCVREVCDLLLSTIKTNE